jgi:hypothetical protein
VPIKDSVSFSIYDQLFVSSPVRFTVPR